MATTVSQVEPTTHPKYRPPIDIACIALDGDSCEEVGKRERKELLTVDYGGQDERRSGGSIAPFVVSNLLSPEECNQLINLVDSNYNNNNVDESKLLQKVDWEYVSSYRDCSRAVLRCPELAATVYRRLLPFLSVEECESVRPFGFDGGCFGDWRPHKINPVIRVSRYDKGGHFAMHRDGAFLENDDVRSVYTVILYLNEPPSFQGGNTSVQVSSTPTSVAVAEGGGLKGEEVARSMGENNITDLVPTTGTALVMLHDTLHSGNHVKDGHKYICRFDVMFRRLGCGMTEHELDMIPARKEAERLYASSIVKQRQDDVEGSTCDYLRAQELQAQLPSARPLSDIEINNKSALLLKALNEDLLVASLRFLTLSDILSLSLVSKQCRMISSNSLLWRELFLIRWPTLLRAESIILPSARDDRSHNDGAIPLTIHEPYSPYRRSKTYKKVYMAVLPCKPQLRKDAGRPDMGNMYDDPPNPNYMFSNLLMTQLDVNKGTSLKWHEVKAVVNAGAIQFAELPLQDGSTTLTIPVFADTELIFAAANISDGSEAWKEIDTCILEIPSHPPHDTATLKKESSWFLKRKRSPEFSNIKTTKQYLAICTKHPLKKEKNKYWESHSLCRGIIADLSHLFIARQTERALRYHNNPSVQTVAVRCDAKTKQWKTAYSRRHLAERFFDVVTFDVGSHSSKFTSSGCALENLILSHNDDHEGPLHFFKEAAQLYRPNDDFRFSAIKEWSELKDIMDTSVARELINAYKEDWGLVPPRKILEAEKGCGSIPSLIAQARGHLWSAKHGLLNHKVGNQCISTNDNVMGGGIYAAQGVYNTSVNPPKPDLKAMSIIIAHLVDHSCVRRPRRRFFLHRRVTCAEHPINIVEPVLGFSEDERIKLISYLSGWDVPFVGFVNGAVAALMCGTNPKQNGIVVMLGSINSGVALVKDGAFVHGIPLKDYNQQMLDVQHQDNQKEKYLKKMDDEIAKEVSSAIKALLEMSNDNIIGIEAPACVLLTGGGATDSIVTLVKHFMTTVNKVNIQVASLEEERHLDAVRGGHVMANISDKWKHFRGVMNHMWAMHVLEPPTNRR